MIPGTEADGGLGADSMLSEGKSVEELFTQSLGSLEQFKGS